MKTNNGAKTENQSESEDSDSDSSSSSSSGDSSDSDDSEDDEPKITKNKKPNSVAVGKKPKNGQSTPRTNLDLLLSLDEDITGLFCKLKLILSTSVYDLVLIYVCHFHHHFLLQ